MSFFEHFNHPYDVKRLRSERQILAGCMDARNRLPEGLEMWHLNVNAARRGGDGRDTQGALRERAQREVHIKL